MSTGTPDNKFYLMNKDKSGYCVTSMTTPSDSLKSDGWLVYYKYADVKTDCSLFSIDGSDNLMVTSIVNGISETGGTGASTNADYAKKLDYYVSVKDNGSADDKEVVITKAKPDPLQAFKWNSDKNGLSHVKSSKFVQSRDASAGDGTTAYGAVLVVKDKASGAPVEMQRKMINDKGELVEFKGTYFDPEKAKAFWEKYKWYIIGAGVLLLIVIAYFLMRKKSSSRDDYAWDDDGGEEEEVVVKKKKSGKKGKKKKASEDDDDDE